MFGSPPLARPVLSPPIPEKALVRVSNRLAIVASLDRSCVVIAHDTLDIECVGNARVCRGFHAHVLVMLLLECEIVHHVVESDTAQ